MYRKQWGLLLSGRTHLGEIDTTVVGEWHTARRTDAIEFYFKVYGPPTHIYCDSVDLSYEIGRQAGALKGLDPSQPPFKVYGPSSVLDVFLNPFLRMWKKDNSPTVESLQEQLEAKDREIHDLKCELDRVRMINDGLFKKLGV